MSRLILPLTDRDVERFWEKVDTTQHCWIWTASTVPPRGYGKFYAHGSLFLSHRVSWAMAYGEPPSDLEVMHKCDVVHCVRPDHLELGTHQDNVDDMHRKGRGAYGERHGMNTKPECRTLGSRNGCAKLTEADVRSIRDLYSSGTVSQCDLAKHFGVRQQAISRIVSGKRWPHVPLGSPITVHRYDASISHPVTISEHHRSRFWKHVDKSGECWVWTAHLFEDGYGQFRYEGRNLKASVFSWMCTHGKPPLGLCVCHECDKRECVRPEHLFLGTNLDNTHDMMRKGRHGSLRGFYGSAQIVP
jgi:DNA-binding XRE family transcriptional regulator